MCDNLFQYLSSCYVMKKDYIECISVKNIYHMNIITHHSLIFDEYLLKIRLKDHYSGKEL